ncbi:uncharacterized protein LOC117645638 isoform X2 [Thrips palmi]|uniref:Uncharacterized protein LOC117645638 isoform X2 n=1 Tax=Thrips palmi TaxID=161013 RepID=A0A6P8ZN62_THRPL|nr:uncharacterized protein LOC117645638 isoform X2 [Thrips palmi]
MTILINTPQFFFIAFLRNLYSLMSLMYSFCCTLKGRPILCQCSLLLSVSVPLFANIVGIFLEDGAVCTYYDFATHGIKYDSGDVVMLPRHDQKTAVVILGIHVILGKAAEAAKVYFKRLCKWDDVPYSEVKVFGHELAPIEEEVSQVAIFETQGIQGPVLVRENVFYLNGQNEPQ